MNEVDHVFHRMNITCFRAHGDKRHHPGPEPALGGQQQNGPQPQKVRAIGGDQSIEAIQSLSGQPVPYGC